MGEKASPFPKVYGWSDLENPQAYKTNSFTGDTLRRVEELEGSRKWGLDLSHEGFSELKVRRDSG